MRVWACQHRVGVSIRSLDRLACFFRSRYDYLHPAQDEEEQPPQPEPLEDDEGLLEDLPMPKRDMSFSVFFEPHFSQTTLGFDPKTSFSKFALQSLQ